MESVEQIVYKIPAPEERYKLLVAERLKKGESVTDERFRNITNIILATHRTDLIGLQSYLQMLSDGEFGQITKQQAEVIEQLNATVSRLISENAGLSDLGKVYNGSKANHANMRKHKILIFEDDKWLADMFSTKYRMEGFEVQAYNDGADVVNRTLKFQPDFISMDILMPKVNGFDAIKQLKSDPRTKDIPVAFLSNLGQDGDISTGKALGAVDYWVMARHTPQELVNKIREHLGLPLQPPKVVPPMSEVQSEPTVTDLPPDKPKPWWQKLFG